MRVGVLGAGGPAGVNVCRALAAADHEVMGLDDDERHLVWAKPYCIGVGTFSAFDADVWHAQPEGLVLLLSERAEAEADLGALIPPPAVIRLCQNKHALATLLAGIGLRSEPLGIGEELPDYLHLAAGSFGLPFWLRATSGAGARAATLVEQLETGFHWIRYWRSRGFEGDFMAEEYLPGREFCYTSLWCEGELMAAFTRERLEWIYPHLAPSGRTGTPSIAETIHDETVNEVARDTILVATAAQPHGIFCVDLACDRAGMPRPTEINAGRWATTSPLYSELGINLQDMHVRLAAGEELEPIGEDIYPAGIRLSRHIDCGHIFSEVPALA